MVPRTRWINKRSRGYDGLKTKRRQQIQGQEVAAGLPEDLTQASGRRGRAHADTETPTPPARDDVECKLCAHWEAPEYSLSPEEGKSQNAPWQHSSSTCVYIHGYKRLWMLTYGAQEFKGIRIFKGSWCSEVFTQMWCSRSWRLYAWLDFYADVLGKYRLNLISGNSYLGATLVWLCHRRTRKMGEATLCTQPQLPRC